MIDNATEAIRWMAAIFAAVAGYYAIRFTLRYRHVNWEASPWGRHVMRFSILIGVAMTTAVVLRVLAIFGFTNALVLALIGAVIYGWVAYEMRRRYYLERETQQEAAIRKKVAEEQAAVHSGDGHLEGDSQ